MVPEEQQAGDFEVVHIPLRTRRRKAIVTFGITFAVVAWGLATLYQSDQLGLNLLGFLPFALVGFGGSVYYWRKDEERRPTPAKIEREKVAREEQERKQQEFDDRWYVRYPIAALMLWGAWFIATEKESLWWVAALMVLGALFQAREVAFIAIVAVGIHWLVLGVASLPVSVAIIIGALIIASAVRRS